MKRSVAFVWILACCISTVTATLCAQAQDSGAEKQKQQKQQDKKSQEQPAAPQSQPNGNPFPEDVKSIPVIPSGDTPDIPNAAEEADSPNAAPRADSDPVRSPEGESSSANSSVDTFSSSRKGLDNLIPDPTTDTADAKGKKGGDVNVIPQETAEKSIDVGNYYMDRKNWKGALSRFQSAMVLAPDNPDVYWGLAECYRHLGQLADARKNYEKVASYDPDSKHGKEAQKALKESDLANAK